MRPWQGAGKSSVAKDHVARGVSEAKAVLCNCFKGRENSRGWNMDSKIKDFQMKTEFSW